MQKGQNEKEEIIEERNEKKRRQRKLRHPRRGQRLLTDLQAKTARNPESRCLMFRESFYSCLQYPFLLVP